MTSLQGKFIDTRPHFPRDYYGRPTHREMLMRFDFQQANQIMEPRWSDKYPGRRPLGVSPSGKFAIYIIQWVPCSMNRLEVSLALKPWVPPSDNFMLSLEDRYHWGVQTVKIPLALKTEERELVEVNFQRAEEKLLYLPLL